MYLYKDLMDDISRLVSKATCGSIGESEQGRAIPYIKVGSGKRVIISGGIHAREWVTTILVMRMAEYAASHTPKAQLYFVPTVNPDGLEIAQVGSDDDRLVQINGSEDFSLWKANSRAVDLNVNFDANYGSGISNVTYPSPENYIGEFAGSERETQALMHLTKTVDPEVTISYHAKGRVVYWEFGQTGERRIRDMAYASKIADVLGYERIDGDGGSAGGYKDWCVQQRGITALTIEIISDEKTHPLCERDLSLDINRNINILDML